jgi:hypothetical protein
MNKQYIIDEIKRTATANGGIPLGHARFFKETGIKVSDWSGRYWARWGDAIREAGLKPNALEAAYDKEELIEHLVGFVREAGRFPVYNELRMKAARDKSFPSHTVWGSHFGTKAGLAKAIVDFCSARADLEDVAALCIPIANEVEKRPEQPSREEEAGFGFVYLLRSGRHYKIGAATRRVAVRESYKFSCPRKLRPSI